MVLWRPVTTRAIFSATSIASEPPVVNSTLALPPGQCSVRASAKRTAGSSVKRRGVNGSVRIWMVSASIRRGCP